MAYNVRPEEPQMIMFYRIGPKSTPFTGAIRNVFMRRAPTSQTASGGDCPLQVRYESGRPSHKMELINIH